MRSVWFSRVVLGAAAVLLASIGLRYVIDPMGAVGPHGIVLGSAEAITIMRVTGSVFLGIALVLLGCLVTNRLLPGLALLATIATSITAVRFLGLAIDGPEGGIPWTTQRPTQQTPPPPRPPPSCRCR